MLLSIFQNIKIVGLNCWDPLDDGLYTVASTINFQLMCLYIYIYIYIYIFMEPSSTGNLRVVFDMPRMDKKFFHLYK